MSQLSGALPLLPTPVPGRVPECPLSSLTPASLRARGFAWVFQSLHPTFPWLFPAEPECLPGAAAQMLTLNKLQLFLLGCVYAFPAVTTGLDYFGRLTLSVVLPFC